MADSHRDGRTNGRATRAEPTSGADAASSQASGSGPMRALACDPDVAAPMVFTTPLHPSAGQRVHVVAISEHPMRSPEIRVIGSGGGEAVVKGRFLEGPPWVQDATFTPSADGRFEVQVGLPGQSTARCTNVTVGRPAVEGSVRASSSPAHGAWDVTREWTPDMESLYAAWIGVMFYVDPGARAGWRPLHQAARDPSRNFLYNYLGLDEDTPDADHHIVMRPDCADTPYHLRAYFSWKMGLPFGFRRCSRGSNLEGPHCTLFKHNQSRTFSANVDPITRFNVFVRDDISTLVQAGTTRTLPSDTWSDLYPIELVRENIRPGTVYVDPDGHVLTISQWVPQSEARMGELQAVDGHPDETISHKSFSRPLFSFYHQVPSGGFKHFRPAVVDHGTIRPMTNTEMVAGGFAPVSDQQARFTNDPDFYRLINRMVNPRPMDPVVAYRGIINVLQQYALDRVEAVQIGVQYQNEHNWRPIEMPNGPKIFEAIGDWEDYSTPARDLRFLIAMDEVDNFPDLVRREPDLFNFGGRRYFEIRRDLDHLRAELLSTLSIPYTGSGGSVRQLTLEQLMRRREAFEHSYNPNDCIEVRWGEPENGAAMQSCEHRAPESQRILLNRFRGWFRDRHRPAIR